MDPVLAVLNQLDWNKVIPVLFGALVVAIGPLVIGYAITHTTTGRLPVDPDDYDIHGRFPGKWRPDWNRDSRESAPENKLA